MEQVERVSVVGAGGRFGSRRAPARLDRGAQARLAISGWRLGAAGLHGPTLLAAPVAEPLGAVVLGWLLVSSVVGGIAAFLAPGWRRGEVAFAAVDVAAALAIASTTPGGYYPVVLITMMRLVQAPARWGLRGAVGVGVPLTAAALAWPSPQVSGLRDPVSLLVACLALVAGGLVCGWFIRRQQAVAERTELALALTFEHSPTATVLTDGEGIVTRVNPAALLLCGAPARDLLERPLATLIDPGDAGALAAVLAGHGGDEVDVRLSTVRGAHWARLLVGRVPAAAGLPAYLVVQAEDVHERRTAAERLAHQATHDALTGLPNRRALHAELDALLAEPGATGALVMIDLDGFKAVNDCHGHEAGDTLLIVVADRLRRACLPGDLAARLAGDEMVFLARDVADQGGALALGQRVLEELIGPADLGPVTVELRASAGARWISAHEVDARQVLRDADAALYRAKDAGRGRVEVAPTSTAPTTTTPSSLRTHPGAYPAGTAGTTA